MINEATREYVMAHRKEDVRQLALKSGGRASGIDLPLALQQIAGWQTACKKLPSWAAIDKIVYPPHLNMEQCSSEQTARYKERLVRELGLASACVDLTGGLGVDFSWISRPFGRRVYVERNAELCEMARHNFQVLGLEAEVVCGDAEDYLKEMGHVDMAFLDPARRDQYGGRTFGIADCTPNVLGLLPLLLRKASTILLKLSPMLDWQQAVRDLRHVSEVHIVSVDNDCKELLMVVQDRSPMAQGEEETASRLTIHCVNLLTKGGEQHFDFTYAGNAQLLPSAAGIVPSYLYEPNASIMKAGCFQELEMRFPIRQLAANSHLFVSDEHVGTFPGRCFQVMATTSMNRQELKVALQDVTQANVAVRNFPMTAEALRRKLKLRDGGTVFIFGTTLADVSHQLFICRKIG